MEKVKEVVHKVTHPSEHKGTTAAGMHTTGTHTTGAHHTTGTHGATTAGPHSSNLANKADPRVDSDLDGSRNAGATTYGTTGHSTHPTTAGPHSSNIANKADPRVDSDLDGSRNAGAATYGTGAHHTGTTGTGLGSTTGHSTNAGPHSSNLANKLDPRVDSDRDGSSNAGASQYGPGAHQTTGTTGFGTGSTTTRTGPHSSGLANAADPRVDSDRDGSRNYGAADYGPGAHHTTGTTGFGTGSATTHTGPHSSGVANAADPRVDSDRDGSRNYGAANYGPGAHHTSGHTGPGSHGLTSGSGPAPHTQGPHKSDMLNKVDPRVDSDRDGSRTVGGNTTGSTY